jgi:hypothetical protein
MSGAPLRLSRRAWLAGAVGAALAVTGGRHHWRRLRRPDAADLAALIRRRLAHLDLAPAAADEFAAEYVRRFGALAMARHHRMTYGGLLGPSTLRRLSPDAARTVLAFERRTISSFLRSTTYFREPASPARYVAFADPYEGACANPFARLDLE